jgi:hypothetical protein
MLSYVISDIFHQWICLSKAYFWWQSHFLVGKIIPVECSLLWDPLDYSSSVPIMLFFCWTWRPCLKRVSFDQNLRQTSLRPFWVGLTFLSLQNPVWERILINKGKIFHSTYMSISIPYYSFPWRLLQPMWFLLVSQTQMAPMSCSLI